MENWQAAEKKRCPYYIVGCKWGKVLGNNGLPIVNKCALSLGKMYPTPYSSRHFYGQWWGLNSNWGRVYQTVWRLVIHSCKLILALSYVYKHISIIEQWWSYFLLIIIVLLLWGWWHINQETEENSVSIDHSIVLCGKMSFAIAFCYYGLLTFID